MWRRIYECRLRTIDASQAKRTGLDLHALGFWPEQIGLEAVIALYTPKSIWNAQNAWATCKGPDAGTSQVKSVGSIPYALEPLARAF